MSFDKSETIFQAGYIYIFCISVRTFITEVKNNSIFMLRQFITRFRYLPSLIYHWTELFTTIRVFQTVTSPDETRMSGDEDITCLHCHHIHDYSDLDCICGDIGLQAPEAHCGPWWAGTRLRPPRPRKNTGGIWESVLLSSHYLFSLTF